MSNPIKKYASEDWVLDLVSDKFDQYQSTLFTLIDYSSGYKYIFRLNNGVLEFERYYKSIKILSLPTKQDYIMGELFNTEGMKVCLVTYDGSEIEIDNYTCSEYITSSTITVGFEDLTVSFDINLNSMDIALIDFDYIKNDDDTYTITGWKGTLNGSPSDKMHVPSSNLIIV